MEKHSRHYNTRNENGVQIKVDEFQEFIDVTSINDTTRRWAPGMKRLELRGGGGAVNMIDETTFEVVATGERLTVE